MDRKEQLEDHVFDSVIVGGGIVGAGLFREQALHELNVLLVDQSDFSSQTSSGSSKMLHGGIRYLENMDFLLVFEALKEKNLWLKLTPHISKEVPFYLPVYKNSKWPLFFLRIGLFLYDLLSLFKNSPHKTLNIPQTLKALPGLNKEGLTGAGMYYDGIVDDSKLALECIYDGLNSPKAKALNYKKVISVTKELTHYKVELEDTLSQERMTITTKFITFATGPFTDQVMKNLNISWKPVILPSKGTHLWLKEDALPIKDSMVLQTRDNRIIFVIPQRKSILIGTTEIPLKPDADFKDIRPTPDEIHYLIQSVNDYFPEHNIDESAILKSFAAVRPLVKSALSSSKTSRTHKIYSPQSNMYVLVGGKYTTFRKMAQDLNAILFKKMCIRHDKSLTKKPLRTTSIVKDPFTNAISEEDIKNIMNKEFVRTREDLIERRLSLHSLRHINNLELQKLIDKNIK